MRSKRQIRLTATQEQISYTALVTAITEKIRKSGEFVKCENIAELRETITAVETERN